MRWFIAIVFLTSALIVGGVSMLPYETLRSFLDQRAGDGSADPFTPAVYRTVTYGLRGLALVFFGSACGASFLQKRAIRQRVRDWQLRSRFRDSCRWYRVLMKGNGGWLLGLTVIGFCVRLPYLFDPLRYDEATTYLVYARLPWYAAISIYHDPNNHLLHSLLVHWSTELFGNAEWGIRLPAFLAGVSLVPLTFLVARAAGGCWAGVAAASVVATSSLLIEYSVIGRGYSLICVWTLLMVLSIQRIHHGGRGLEWVVLPLWTALGFWTIPVMLYPAVLMGTWLVVLGPPSRASRASWIRNIGGAGLLTGLLILVFYTPALIVSGADSLLASATRPTTSMTERVQSAQQAVVATFALLQRDWPLPTRLFVWGAVIWFAVTSPSWRTPLKLLAAGTVCLLVPLIHSVIPPPRVWQFLLPLVAILTGIGVSRFVGNGGRSRQRRVLLLGGMLLVVFPLFSQLKHNSIRTSDQAGACPDAGDVVQELITNSEWLPSPSTPIVAVSPVSAPVVYSAMRMKLPETHFDIPRHETVDGAIVLTNTRTQQAPGAVIAQLQLDHLFAAGEFELLETFPGIWMFRYRMSAREPSDQVVSPL